MKYFLAICIFIYTNVLYANINLIKKGNNDSNTTLLIIGGIHGNEPGGYFAPEILATHYTIKSKNVWIIPDLNKASIIADKRGIHGDMNRKFNHIKKNDKDKKIVEEIKKIILLPNISLILNLHDGHGFYRKKSEGNIYNPDAWGQSCVIDQCKLLRAQPFGDLNHIALTVKDNINKKLLKKHHRFNVKNTNTKNGNTSMQQSLTYFAITHSKPAFAIETSKSLSSVAQKVFYQLVAIEEYMKIMRINYNRDFNLNVKELAKIIKNYGELEINHNILLNLDNIKKSLSYIPIESKSNKFSFSNPLGIIKKNRNGVYNVYIGNIKVTSLSPQYFKMSSYCPNTYDVKVDGKLISLQKASEFYVNDDFKIIGNNSCRVNIIGYQSAKGGSESNLKISLTDLDKRYAIDKDNKSYRIEFYQGGKFCSMLIVKFK